ncbi:hypothetical protein D3C81_748170 [compost metagenome]
MLMRCLLLLSVPLAAHAASPERLSPEQAFDLYARAVLESDSQAADTLRAARPADALLSDDIISSLLTLVPTIVKDAGRLAADNNIPASLATEYGDLLATTYARTRCRATGRGTDTVRAATASNDEVAISFSCQVPAWDLDSGMLADPVVRQQIRGNDAQAMRVMIQALRATPMREMTGTASVHGTHETGYFPDAFTHTPFMPVIQSVWPMALLEEPGHE